MTESTNSTFELLDSKIHKNLKIDTSLLNTKLNRVNVSSVIVSELNTLVHEYAIFMTKSPSSGELQLTAVLGFDAGENLYLDGNNWRATYMPLDIIRRPFQAYMPDKNKMDQGHLAIDVAAEQVNKKKGAALFDEQGNKTEYLQKIETTFSQIMGGVPYTAALLKEAEDLKLIEPVTITVEIPNRGKVDLNGLYGFDKKAIDKLTGAALKKAHQSGLLQVIHLMLSSTIHLQKLIGWSAANNK
ncbi:SapC family protein [Paraglaciecola sp. L3A3]|uniref:SapC family protein n=1 Tax=Paraglaciecola sp. L3A3 TaxID=2686358 RepID=UPI00131A6B9A|nr:SapC family protein [Paraglaciecola sp. L3A3]